MSSASSSPPTLCKICNKVIELTDTSAIARHGHTAAEKASFHGRCYYDKKSEEARFYRLFYDGVADYSDSDDYEDMGADDGKADDDDEK